MTHIREIDGRWYAFEQFGGRVYSIGRDEPRNDGGGRIWAKYTNEGIKYVASPSPSRKAAQQKASRNGTYGGEV